MGAIKQSMNDGFVRGMCGKEEDTSKARLLTNAEPLPNEIKKIYWIAVAMCAIGVFYIPLLAAGVIALMVIYSIDESICDHKVQRLRRFKFKYNSNVEYEEIFNALHPILADEYGMTIDKRKDGVIAINCKDFIYDLIINDDCTFTLWWRTTLKKMRLRGKYEKYKIFLKDMGVIAYTIQQIAKPEETSMVSDSKVNPELDVTDNESLAVE